MAISVIQPQSRGLSDILGIINVVNNIRAENRLQRRQRAQFPETTIFAEDKPSILESILGRAKPTVEQPPLVGAEELFQVPGQRPITPIVPEIDIPSGLTTIQPREPAQAVDPSLRAAGVQAPEATVFPEVAERIRKETPQREAAKQQRGFFRQTVTTIPGTYRQKTSTLNQQVQQQLALARTPRQKLRVLTKAFQIQEQWDKLRANSMGVPINRVDQGEKLYGGRSQLMMSILPRGRGGRVSAKDIKGKFYNVDTGKFAVSLGINPDGTLPEGWRFLGVTNIENMKNKWRGIIKNQPNTPEAFDAQTNLDIEAGRIDTDEVRFRREGARRGFTSFTDMGRAILSSMGKDPGTLTGAEIDKELRSLRRNIPKEPRKRGGISERVRRKVSGKK